MTRTRYALVGAGSRAQRHVSALTGPHADRAALVAICEPNPEGLHPVLDPNASVGRTAASQRPEGERLLLQRHWEEPVEIPIDAGAGGHGGGDALLLADVFVGPDEDPLGRPAMWRDGIRSIAVGIAGNRSLETDPPVRTAGLGIPLLAREDA